SAPARKVASPHGPSRPLKAPSKPIRELRHKVSARVPGKAKRSASPYRSIAFGLDVGAVVLGFFMFSFFNERFIAPFIQPSRNVSDTPIITGSQVGSNSEIIIPKINVEIPVVYGV